jgi:hypothetical protein
MGSIATSSTGPFFPPELPQTTRTVVPSSSVATGMAHAVPVLDSPGEDVARV